MTDFDSQFKQLRAQADVTHSHLSPQQRDEWAMHVVKTHPGFHAEPSMENLVAQERTKWATAVADNLHVVQQQNAPPKVKLYHDSRLILQVATIALLLGILLLSAVRGHSAPPPKRREYSRAVMTNLRMKAPLPKPQTIVNPSQFKFDASGFLYVDCPGCPGGGAGGGTSSTFGQPFPALGTAAGGWDGTDMVPFKMDSGDDLFVTCLTAAKCPVDVPALEIAEGAASSGVLGPLIQGAVSAAAPTYVNGQVDRLSLDLNGALRVNPSGSTQPVSCSPACPVNLQQINGVTTSTGAGATGTGSQRVGVAQDSTTIAGAAPGTAGSPGTSVVSAQGVAGGTPLPASCTAANCGINNQQVAGTTIDTNTGNASAGTQRFVIATNQPALPAWGDGSTGSAVPSGANYMGANGSGNLTGIIACDHSSPVNISTATTTQIVAISGTAGVTYICSIDLVTNAANNVALVSGSGTNCASNLAGMAGGTTAATGWPFPANGGLAKGSGLGMVYKTVTTNNEICLVTSAATQISGSIAWTQTN